MSILVGITRHSICSILMLGINGCKEILVLNKMSFIIVSFLGYF